MTIKTWDEALDSQISDGQIVTTLDIRAAMQTEINELRTALENAERKLTALAAQEPVAYIGYSPTKGNGQRLFWKLWAAQEYANDVTPLYTKAAP